MPRYNITPPLGSSGERTPVVVGFDAEGAESLLLGRLNEGGPLRDVRIDTGSESVIAIFGKRGSGKSYTLGVIAEALGATAPQDSSISSVSGAHGALLLDTLDIFWSTEVRLTDENESHRAAIQDLKSWQIDAPDVAVRVWVPKGFRAAFTPDRYSDFSIATSELSGDDIADLMDVDSQRDAQGQLILEVVDKSRESGRSFSFGTMLDILETDVDIERYYAPQSIRAARQRLRHFASLPIFDDESGTSLAELIVPGQLSVLELGQLPNSLRAVIASVLLRRLHRERAEASSAEKQLRLNSRLSADERRRIEDFVSHALPPTWVLVDEAQNILPSERSVKSSDAVVRFVREGRNFGLSFVLTTQQPSAVDQRILAQADTVICHKLTVAADIARMRENLKCAEPATVNDGPTILDLAAFLRRLDRGEAVVTNSESERLFALAVRPRVVPHGGGGFEMK